MKAIVAGTGGSKLKLSNGQIIGPFGGELLRRALINNPGAEIVSEERPKSIEIPDGHFTVPK